MNPILPPVPLRTPCCATILPEARCIWRAVDCWLGVGHNLVWVTPPFGRHPPEFNRIRPTFGIWPTCADLDPEIGQTWGPMLGRSRPNFGRRRPDLLELDRTWTEFDKRLGPFSASWGDFDRIGADFDQPFKVRDEFEQIQADFGRISRLFANCLAEWTKEVRVGFNSSQIFCAFWGERAARLLETCFRGRCPGILRMPAGGLRPKLAEFDKIRTMFGEIGLLSVESRKSMLADLGPEMAQNLPTIHRDMSPISPNTVRCLPNSVNFGRSPRPACGECPDIAPGSKFQASFRQSRGSRGLSVSEVGVLSPPSGPPNREVMLRIMRDERAKLHGLPPKGGPGLAPDLCVLSPAPFCCPGVPVVCRRVSRRLTYRYPGHGRVVVMASAPVVSRWLFCLSLLKVITHGHWKHARIDVYGFECSGLSPGGRVRVMVRGCAVAIPSSTALHTDLPQPPPHPKGGGVAILPHPPPRAPKVFLAGQCASSRGGEAALGRE